MRLDTDVFTANEIPVLYSEGDVLAQNCEGLSLADAANARVGDCAATGAFCLEESCTDTEVGTDCFCFVDGVEQQFPVGCMESAQIMVPVPSSLSLTMLAAKPENVSTEVVLSNPGGETLVWRLDGEHGQSLTGLEVSPTSGVVAAGSLQILTVRVPSRGVVSRGDPYLGNLSLVATSGVCVCREQRRVIDTSVFIDAAVSASDTVVTLDERTIANLTASGTFSFIVTPKDFIGLQILDATDVAFTGALRHVASDASVACGVTYSTGKHIGTCRLPADMSAGAFTLTVTDTSNTIVGGGSFDVLVAQCPPSYYWTGDSCARCEGHATCGAGTTMATLDVEEGYWRNGATSTTIRQCIFGEIECRGGSNIAAQCADHHDGPLCANCEAGYNLNKLDRSCVRCDAAAKSEGRVFIVIGTIGVALVMTVVAVVWNLEEFQDIRSLFQGIAFLGARFRDLFKIVLVYLQIVSAYLQGLLDVQWPPIYVSFAVNMDIVNLNIAQFFDASCAMQSSYFNTILVSTLLPFVLTALIGVYFLKKLRKCANAADSAALKARCFGYFLTMTYIVFPGTSSVLLRTFLCDDDFDNGASFLKADYSISCNSDSYRLWAYGYCVAMLLVFTVGIPTFYAALLWRNRSRLNPDVARILDELAATSPRQEEAESVASAAGFEPGDDEFIAATERRKPRHELHTLARRIAESDRTLAAERAKGVAIHVRALKEQADRLEAAALEAAEGGDGHGEGAPKKRRRSSAAKLAEKVRAKLEVPNRWEDCAPEHAAYVASLEELISTAHKRLVVLYRQQDESIRYLAFLWGAYEADHYFWECTECVRRLALTGLLVFLPSGVGQIISASLLAFVSLACYVAFNPFNDRAAGQAAILSQGVLFLQLFLAILLRLDVFASESDTNTAGMWLIVLNLLPPAQLAFEAYRVYRANKYAEKGTSEGDAAGRTSSAVAPEPTTEVAMIRPKEHTPHGPAEESRGLSAVSIDADEPRRAVGTTLLA